MKYVFFGSPDFAAIILEKLAKSGYIPSAVVCNPDEPFGRKKIITSPAVKQLITHNHWPTEIFQPQTTKELLAIRHKLLAVNADIFLVAAYAKIIPKEIIELPKLKTIGLHPSLLPKYRGSSPIQSAILNGEKQTGVSIFLIDEKVDHGPILTEEKLDIDDKNYENLEKILAESGANLFVKIINDYLNNKIKPRIQNENEATYTKKFTTEDGKIDLNKESPLDIVKKIRALNPDPGTFTNLETNKKTIRLKILEADLDKGGSLNITKVQPEGKNPMTYKEFLNGYKINPAS